MLLGASTTTAGIRSWACTSSARRTTTALARGVVPIIPNYTEVTGAAHLLQKYQAERWGAEVGLRLDQMTLKVAGYDIYQQLFKDTKHFTNLTYSIGGHYHLSPCGT